MAIVKHIAVHRSPLKLIRYMLNEKKTDETKLVTGLNCSTDPESAYEEMGNTFEHFAKERFFKKSLNDENCGKEKIRLHHYIQSFKPDEITPEQAHRIGVEWAEKVFGRDHQVLVVTHVDRRHIHNHYAVAAYDLNGKKWYGNKTTLKRCREVSDKFCESYGLSVIEKPTYRANQKYSNWLARQNGTSWKEQLCDDIDRIVLMENVRSIDDMVKQLCSRGYQVRRGKYLSVKPVKLKNIKAVRTIRLGDGYALDELQYRITNKNREMSLSEIAKYQGIQREYAMCLRELQIMVYRKQTDLHMATYGELCRNAELLTYLCRNGIHSKEAFENIVNDTKDKWDRIKKSRDELLDKIEQEEKILQCGARYLELNKIKLPTAEQLDELAELSFLSKYKLHSAEDIASHGQEHERLKRELSETETSLAAAEKEKSEAANNYKTYLRQIQTDYDFIIERKRKEQKEIKKSEMELLKQKELQKQKQYSRTNGTYCR